MLVLLCGIGVDVASVLIDVVVLSHHPLPSCTRGSGASHFSAWDNHSSITFPMLYKR